jgi:hypothetical protein
MSKAINGSKNRIDENQGFAAAVPDNPHKWLLYEYHLFDHMKPFPVSLHLSVYAGQDVRYEWTAGSMCQDSFHNGGNGNEYSSHFLLNSVDKPIIHCLKETYSYAYCMSI